jgi:glycosyltransferase involved in cell wall biosynthesis
MRILFANEARHGAGGVETYLASLLEPLAAGGHDVAMLYQNPSAEHGPTRITTAEAWSVADLGLDQAIAHARAWRPDVCFSHNMRLLDVDERLLAEWPTFKMMHGYFGTCVSGQKAFSFPSLEPCSRRCEAACLLFYVPRRCGQLRPDRMLSQYSWAMRQQQLFSRYSGIVVASEHMRKEYSRYNVPASRIHTIPLFATVDDGRSLEAPAIDILFIGRMTALKGSEVLLEAAAYAAHELKRRVRLVFAGEGPDRPMLKQLARELDDAGSVTADFPGWVDAATRSALLARASLVAVPSIWPEPFGLVGLEAAHHGVPSVAFDVGGISEWLTHGVSGCLVDLRGGAKAFGDALAQILGDPGVRARLSAGARESATRFSAGIHVSALERVFDAALRSAATS